MARARTCAGRTVLARAAATLAAASALGCATCTPAVAAGEPEIRTAGIDATDRLVVAWRLQPDTTFDFLEFSSIAIANPFVPGAFAGRNVVASACAAPGDGCLAPPSLEVYRSTDPVARDRRYYVRVNARTAQRRLRSSAIWVLDNGKPTLPGGGRPAATPTGTPVIGEPYRPPARSAIPNPRFSLLTRPRTIASVIRHGVRMRVTCPAISCYAIVALQLGSTTLVFSDTTTRPGVAQTFVLRPRPNRRAVLRRRHRARLDVLADVRYPGGKRVRIARRLSVRR